MAKEKTNTKKENEIKEIENNTNLKEELEEYINNKIDDKIDLSKINKEIKEYVNVLLKKDLSYEVEKANKRLLKEKNRKIFFKNVIIFLLILVIFFLTYLLYKSHYFDKYFTGETEKEVIIKEVEKTPEVVTPVVQTFEDLVKEYGYLIDNYSINENSEYVEDYYNGKLTESIKKYITLNNISFDKLSIEEDYNLIEKDLIKNKYSELFFGDFSPSSFDYNDNKIRFITKLDLFMSNKLLEKQKSSIKREISDIVIEDDVIKITTVDGIIKDGKLYNILTGKEVVSYKKNELINYEDSLNKITYIFKDKKLENIEV